MGARRWFFRQLAVHAWDRRGISPLNAISVTAILANLLLLILSTEPDVYDAWGASFFVQAEIAFTALFTAEYVLRVWSAGEDPRCRGVRGRLRYMRTPVALLDLAAILPTLLVFADIEVGFAKVLRLARLAKLARFGAFSVALDLLARAVTRRRYELAVSLAIALALMLLAATAMWYVEGDAQPKTFGSIPRAAWWSIITMTTVGYGDATPVTAAGKVLAGFTALLGVATVAIPTGIMASSFADTIHERRSSR